ncbi:MAG: DUF2271 domain-containing protein [Candidatus Marinimicrobia bacterium]|nr:DUF2271 domain-containing protein [Candidatus Neomarinimicrobiota bacterium]
MKTGKSWLTLGLVLCFGLSLYGQDFNEFLAKAENFNQAGNFEQAAKVMEEAIRLFPDNAVAHSYLGFYLGMQAGQTMNFIKAGQLIGNAYEMLDKAVEMDANNPVVRFNRGVMGVSVPPFLNKLDEGVGDLEFVANMYQAAPDKFPVDLIASAYNYLGDGYLKQNKTENAKVAWEKVTAIAPDTPLAKSARQNLAKLGAPAPPKAEPVTLKLSPEDIKILEEAVKKNPNSADLYLKLGQAYLANGEAEKALEAGQKSLDLDSTDIQAHLLRINAYEQTVSTGYDARIYDDTNFRTNQAFKIVELTEKAVQVAPDNPEALLARGCIGVMMPFFVEKLDAAIKDLEKVTRSSASDEVKAEAFYWLGYAYQKKAMTNWINVVKNYSETEASRMAFESMSPNIKHFDPEKYQKPFLAIDFVLGFRDELEPQTAVWIEDSKGNFVKTVYISGFSAFAKEKQINLPRWSRSSAYKDVDGVTGASIDLGQHIYVWDLKNSAGKTVKAGEYVAKVEVAYWPSMQYQAVAVPITIGKKNAKMIVKEGNLIPYAEVNYFATQAKK